MVLILKKGASKQEIQEVDDILYQKNKSDGFKASKYNGKIKLKEDALIIQKRMRDEWERNIS